VVCSDSSGRKSDSTLTVGSNELTLRNFKISSLLTITTHSTTQRPSKSLNSQRASFVDTPGRSNLSRSSPFSSSSLLASTHSDSPYNPQYLHNISPTALSSLIYFHAFIWLPRPSTKLSTPFATSVNMGWRQKTLIRASADSTRREEVRSKRRRYHTLLPSFLLLLFLRTSRFSYSHFGNV